MKPLKILGIYRDPKFSNNAIEADRLILQESLAKLQRAFVGPMQLDFWEEGEAKAKTSGNYDLVFTMTQSEETLQALDKIFPKASVWNSTLAIRNCYRKTMSQTLINLPVNYVPFQILATDAITHLPAGESYWLKRSDFHAICDDDVCLAESPAEAEAKLAKFGQRGVREVIIQKHIVGDIYKFYGVKNKFFRPIKVRSFLSEPPPPDLVSLESMASIAATAMELRIYGGDAILDAHGKFHLIDLNDWPSFRICREDASSAIAELALEHLSELSSAQKPTVVTASRI
ncbi:MAG: hypothetical protein ACXVBE_01705 [Bdellovibrionota bacterium]